MAALPDAARSLIGLQVEELRPQPFTVAITVPGMVRSDQDTTALVGPIIEGRISQVLVGWGETVKRGQVLAWLDSAEVGEARAAWFRAQAELQVADATVKRLQQLAADRIVASKDLSAAEGERATAQAESDAARNTLRILGFSDDDVEQLSSQDAGSRVPLVAPIDGTIVDRTAVTGAWAEPSAALFTIMDLGTLWVDARVYEKDLGAVQPGQELSVSVIAAPDRSVSGRVSYVGSTVDDATRTTIVRTVVANPDGLLKPGMFASVRIVTRESSGSLLLPEGAVLQAPDKRQVVVEEAAGRYQLRDVRVGATADGRVEILDGLHAGERVVTGGQNQIATQLAADAASATP
ncbi:MAG TPA: efflux RND transporter periplasmic adaptor subunit [Planctomycetota bacterium]|nr:efflux RND transporter periplasmic adaptor subunit [Planctomycetota bacterium]